MQNEIETKPNETNQNQTKRNQKSEYCRYVRDVLL